MNHPRSDRDFQGKKEDDPSHSKFPKIPSSSRHWSNYKNPRIVRVSRTFGGKDRHSKVCTIRGLRDRRIRLSVPTAIQLYDLQDRLGLNQPSKVVDWLLDATKLDIDKLPPLPMFPIHQPIPPPLDTSHFLSSNLGIGSMKEGIKMSEPPNDERESFGGFVAQISAQNLFPLNNTTAQSNNPFPNFPYTSYFHWDPSNLSLSQSGGGFAAFTNNQADDNRLPLPSNSDLYFYPSAAAMPSFNMPNASFPPSMENNDQLSQMNNQNMASIALPTTLNLISPPVKSSSFGHHMNSKSVYSLQESDARRLLKDNNKS